MHGNEKLDEAVSVGQLIIQLSNSLLKNKQTNKQKYNIWQQFRTNKTLTVTQTYSYLHLLS